MRTRFFSGKALICWGSSTSLVSLLTNISYAFFGGMRQFVAKIPSMDEILMGYWVAGQVSTIMSIVMYKINFRVGYMILSRVFMILC